MHAAPLRYVVAFQPQSGVFDGRSPFHSVAGDTNIASANNVDHIIACWGRREWPIRCRAKAGLNERGRERERERIIEHPHHVVCTVHTMLALARCVCVLEIRSVGSKPQRQAVAIVRTLTVSCSVHTLAHTRTSSRVVWCTSTGRRRRGSFRSVADVDASVRFEVRAFSHVIRGAVVAHRYGRRQRCERRLISALCECVSV